MKNNEEIDLIKFIERLCEEFSLELEQSSENHFKINTGNASGISININIEENYKLSFYFIQRTYDVFYQGDRTDAHVVLSLLFSVFIKLSDSPISSSLFDIPHPMIEDEIWGRYIMPEQMPSFLGVSTYEQLKQAIYKIICNVYIWRNMLWDFAGCPCDNCMKEEQINNNRDYDLSNETVESIEKLYNKSQHINSGTRMRPKWNYLYDTVNEVTIVESEELSLFIMKLLDNKKKTENIVQGINGELIVDKGINNFIHSNLKVEFENLIKSLDIDKNQEFPIIPLENMVVAISGPFIIALGRLSGNFEFKSERELIRKRHNTEAEILFPIPSFTWLENPCSNQFENLIKALLEREPNVISVRKPAPINQGDKGRDLIIEWNVIDRKMMSKAHPPTNVIKVVGQCKASNNSVGKSKVIDIRDTVETHNSKGYFLAVTTQITAPLTEKLESLQHNDIWTLWWNREDIEFRLSKNQDLIPDFPKVIKVKHKIKFVDKE